MSEIIYDIVNSAIDIAFTKDKYQLNLYEYLTFQNAKRKEVLSFLESNLGRALVNQVEELDMYLNGGSGEQILKAAYGWMGKPRVRKIRNYLNQIIQDAKDYEQSKKPGRKKRARITNK
jgi:F0F1-type ATP synthase beta subunit